MQTITIKAAQRDERGKGAASRLRRTGKIPAIAYGKSLPARSLAVSPNQLKQVLSSEHGRNTVIELDFDGADKLTVLLRDTQHHPVSREFLHADFVQIKLDEPVDVEVPLELTGKAQGVVLGGTLRQVYRKLPIRSLPEKIPVKVVYDVTALGLDGHVAPKDLALPEGVEVRLAADQTLVAIVKEKHAEEEAAASAAGGPPSKAPPAAKAGAKEEKKK